MPQLDVKIGGLCLFVQGEKDGRQATYVLMPDLPAQGGGTHKAAIAFSGIIEKSYHKRVKYDLRGELHLGTSKASQPLPSIIPDVSSFVAPSRVEPKWLDCACPTSRLGARVVLPADITYTVNASLALFTVTYLDDDGKLVSETRQPPTDLRFTLSVGKTLRVGDQRIAVPDWATSMVIANVPGGDIDMGAMHHAKGEKVAHYDGYYQMHGLATGPSPEVTVEFTPVTQGAGMASVQSFSAGFMFFADPLMCSVGQGALGSDIAESGENDS